MWYYYVYVFKRESVFLWIYDRLHWEYKRFNKTWLFSNIWSKLTLTRWTCTLKPIKIASKHHLLFVCLFILCRGQHIITHRWNQTYYTPVDQCLAAGRLYTCVCVLHLLGKAPHPTSPYPTSTCVLKLPLAIHRCNQTN